MTKGCVKDVSRKFQDVLRYFLVCSMYVSIGCFKRASRVFQGYFMERGCSGLSHLVTKVLLVVLLQEDITDRDLKKSRPWYTCDLSLHQVSAMSVHYF